MVGCEGVSMKLFDARKGRAGSEKRRIQEIVVRDLKAGAF